jgi:hypothetical protein
MTYLSPSLTAAGSLGSPAFGVDGGSMCFTRGVVDNLELKVDCLSSFARRGPSSPKTPTSSREGKENVPVLIDRLGVVYPNSASRSAISDKISKAILHPYTSVWRYTLRCSGVVVYVCLVSEDM